MVLQGIAAAVFAVFMGVFLVFYIKSRGQYDEYMEYVDKEEYGLKDFIPIGLAMSEAADWERLMPMTLRSVLP